MANDTKKIEEARLVQQQQQQQQSPEAKRFKFLNHTEFGDLTDAEKLAYIKSAAAELEAMDPTHRRGA